MLKKITVNDLDKLMDFWKYEYLKESNSFRTLNISSEYNYIKEQFTQNIQSTIVYTEDDDLCGYVSVNEKNEVWGILVKSTIRREGIGSVLLEQCKKVYKILKVYIPVNDSVCTNFFGKNGFTEIQQNENSKEGFALMEWKKENKSKAKLIYFNDDIDKKYLNKSLGYSYENINVDDLLGNKKHEKGEVQDIKSYISIRKKLEAVMDTENILLYIDYNNYNKYLDEHIKEIVKIKRINLTVIVCEPFTIESSKKDNVVNEIQDSYKDYNIIKIDCSFDNLDSDIAVNQIFEKRAEILVKKISDIAQNM